MGPGVVRIQFDGVIQYADRLPGRAVGMLGEEVQAADETLPGVEALRRLAPGPFDLRLLQLRRDRAEDAARDLVLQIENVLNRTIEAVRPEMRAGRGVDELAGDAHPVAGPAHATLQHIAHAKFPPHLL